MIRLKGHEIETGHIQGSVLIVCANMLGFPRVLKPFLERELVAQVLQVLWQYRTQESSMALASDMSPPKQGPQCIPLRLEGSLHEPRYKKALNPEPTALNQRQP